MELSERQRGSAAHGSPWGRFGALPRLLALGFCFFPPAPTLVMLPRLDDSFSHLLPSARIIIRCVAPLHDALTTASLIQFRHYSPLARIIPSRLLHSLAAGHDVCRCFSLLQISFWLAQCVSPFRRYLSLGHRCFPIRDSATAHRSIWLARPLLTITQRHSEGVLDLTLYGCLSFRVGALWLFISSGNPQRQSRPHLLFPSSPWHYALFGTTLRLARRSTWLFALPGSPALC